MDWKWLLLISPVIALAITVPLLLYYRKNLRITGEFKKGDTTKFELSVDLHENP